MTEADFQTRFTKWAKYNLKAPASCELKISKSPSIPFSAVMEHQVAALLSAKHKGLAYKIPDVGLAPKPFDFFKIKGDAWVVIMFYRRGQKEFFMIDIDDFVTEMQTSERRSLTESRAREIGLAFCLA